MLRLHQPVRSLPVEHWTKIRRKWFKIYEKSIADTCPRRQTFFKIWHVKKKRVWFFSIEREKNENIWKKLVKFEKIEKHLIDLNFTSNWKSIEFEKFEKHFQIWIRFERFSNRVLGVNWPKFECLRTLQVYNTNNASSSNFQIPFFSRILWGAGVWGGTLYRATPVEKHEERT